MPLIPTGEAAQQQFRMVYEVVRMKGLGTNPEGLARTRRSAVEIATRIVCEEHPAFRPEFDPRLLAGD
jgi:hypothetical protein